MGWTVSYIKSFSWSVVFFCCSSKKSPSIQWPYPWQNQDRIGFQDGVISKQNFLSFLLGLRGSFSQARGARGGWRGYFVESMLVFFGASGARKKLPPLHGSCLRFSGVFVKWGAGIVWKWDLWELLGHHHLKSERFHFVIFMKAFGFFQVVLGFGNLVGIVLNCISLQNFYLGILGILFSTCFHHKKSRFPKKSVSAAQPWINFHALYFQSILDFLSGFMSARFPYASPQDGDKGDKDFQSSESSATTKESATNVIPDGKKLGRSGRFCLQFPILLHQKLGGKQFKW